MVEQAKEAAKAIHGLGPGGNKAYYAQLQQSGDRGSRGGGGGGSGACTSGGGGGSGSQRRFGDSSAAGPQGGPSGQQRQPSHQGPRGQGSRAAQTEGAANVELRDGNRTSGQDGGTSQGRGGGGHRSYSHKDKNKAAVGNHHRKDRALKKMGMM